MPSVSSLTSSADTYSTGHASWINSADTAYVTVSITGPGSPAQPVIASGGASATFSNLSASSTYTVTVTPQDSNHVNGTTSTTSFTTPANPNVPPSGSTSISATAQSGHQFTVSWNAVSGATGYYLYKSSDGGTNYYPWDYGNTGTADVGNVTSHSCPADYEWTNYQFQVTPYNSYGNGPNSYSGAYRSMDETAPSVSSFYSTQIQATQVTVYIAGNDNNPASTPPASPSGIQRFAMYKNGVFDGYANVNGPSNNTTQNQYYTFTGLTGGTTYTFEARADDYSGNLSPQGAFTINVTTTNRPANFAWTNPKTSGGDFNLSAAEWNAFTQRINDFRAYKSLTAYTFTSAGTGVTFTAAMFNEAKTAIDAMSPPTATPASAVSGNYIYASQMNDIVTSLNSIP